MFSHHFIAARHPGSEFSSSSLLSCRERSRLFRSIIYTFIVWPGGNFPFWPIVPTRPRSLLNTSNYGMNSIVALFRTRESPPARSFSILVARTWIINISRLISRTIYATRGRRIQARSGWLWRSCIRRLYSFQFIKFYFSIWEETANSSHPSMPKWN